MVLLLALGSVAAAEAEETADETVYVYGTRESEKARRRLARKLKQEGYKRSEKVGDYTVYKHDIPWHPQVVVHDDGWVYVRRQPPRLHSPGYSFADQGPLTNYLWCIPTLMTACVATGGWFIGPRKLQRLEGDVLDATRLEVRNLNDAVMREHLDRRLNYDIPDELARIWADTAMPAEVRRGMLYAFWDSRTDGEAGDAARAAIRAFLVGVVQASDAPYTAAELEALNATRSGVPALELPTR